MDRNTLAIHRLLGEIIFGTVLVPNILKNIKNNANMNNHIKRNTEIMPFEVFLGGLFLLSWISYDKRKRRAIMKLRNILIVVKDIEKSKKFYHDLFGLDMILDNDGNMILTEGLVLQDEAIWKEFLDKDIKYESNASELYFEERNIEDFVEKLDRLYPDIKYVNRLMIHSWGQKVVRFYDLDGNLIEVGTPMG